MYHTGLKIAAKFHWFCLNGLKSSKKKQQQKKQAAQGPQPAHLSETATADMKMACNIFPVLSNIETYDKAMA